MNKAELLELVRIITEQEKKSVELGRALLYDPEGASLYDILRSRGSVDEVSTSCYVTICCIA
jgi:hypothetical protein